MLIISALSLVLIFPFVSSGYEKSDLISLELEDLMNVEIETASKKIQKINDTPAAAFVLTTEDIKRSGATNIMDLLRLVPGVHVARIDANKWAITCRGFNGRFSNKLLVMIDGRTVYSPIFSGVLWDMQDIMVEDIEKIEVVRGPGSTLWGANAVNGVINIITKNSAKSLGTRIDAGMGNEEKAYTYAKYGGKIGENTTYRLSGKYSDKDKGWSSSGMNVDDGWNTSRCGARIDMDRGDTKALFMAEASDTDVSESNLYSSIAVVPSATQSLNSVSKASPLPRNAKSFLYGQYALAKIEKNLDNTSSISFQGYFDNAVRNSSNTNMNQQTTDLYAQYRLPTVKRNDIITGGGARFMNDSFKSDTPYYGLNPEEYSYNLFNFFIQDEIEAVEDFFFITAGTKLERNDFSGFEFQPSARAIVKPADNSSVWCSISRAVRTPSRGEETAFVKMQPPILGMPTITLLSSSEVMSEKLDAYEFGIRQGIGKSQSIDIAFFYNDYTDLRTLEVNENYRLQIANKMKGNARGFEIFYEINIMPGWMMSAGYTYFIMDLKKMGGDPFDIEYSTENTDPRNKVELRSAFDLSDTIRLDLWMRYVDEVKIYDIPAYCSVDASLGWQITPNVEFSFSARDIFDDSHPEYPPEILQTLPTELERSLFAKISWKI